MLTTLASCFIALASFAANPQLGEALPTEESSYSATGEHAEQCYYQCYWWCDAWGNWHYVCRWICY